MHMQTYMLRLSCVEVALWAQLVLLGNSAHTAAGSICDLSLVLWGGLGSWGEFPDSKRSTG